MEYPNWFQQVGGDINFDKYLTGMPEDPVFLQIGAFVGHASSWLLDHFPTAALYDVDTWEGSDEDEHAQFDWTDVEAEYDARMAQYGERLHKCKMTSDDFFLMTPNQAFDFVYVDGAHTAFQVMKDASHAARVIKPGGVIGFDDYTWGLSLPVSDRPHDAIDIFLAQFAGKYTLLEQNLQVWVRWAV